MYCNQCGQSIADDSRFCKHCGAAQASSTGQPTVARPQPARAQPSSGQIIAAVVGGFFVLLLIIGSLGSDSNQTGQLDRNVAGLSSDGDAALDAAGRNVSSSMDTDRWSYSTDGDKVRGGTTYYATTTSTNSISQSFPYDSATTMDMTLRKSPAYGTDVILTISSGQMMCSSYDGCSGSVRFDDGPAQRIEFNGPADHSSEVVFVVGAKSFIAKVRKAKKVVIEKTLYQAGAPQFEFDVRGLKWDH